MAAMTMCPRCGSTFLQPLRCEAKGSDVVVVELRCPDCMTWLKAPHTRADMRELDRRQAEYRGVIVASYEKLVAERWRRSRTAGAARWKSTSSAPTTSRSRRYATADQAPDDQRDAPERHEGAADDREDALRMPVPPGVTT